MSTEQEDAVLLLELEEKITQRIRQQIFVALNGGGGESPFVLDPYTLQKTMKFALLNDGAFIAELTKRIGQRMSQTY